MYDIFICHASEDKDTVARPLAEGLAAAGVRVWYDEFSLKLGDSLRASIERGLAESRYGVVILSPYFFGKNWPQAELNGLFAKEVGTGEKTILPIWHDIDYSYLVKRSPIIADRLAARTEQGLDGIIEKLLDIIDDKYEHRTKDRLTISVSPTLIRLYAKDWRVKTPIIVSNRSEVPVYSVWIKISIDTNDVESHSVHTVLDDKFGIMSGNMGNIEMNPDVIRYDCVDSKGKEMVGILFHTIDPKSSRRFVVWGTTPIPSTAYIEVWAFHTEPAEMLERTDTVSMPFKLPEDIQLRAMHVLLRKRR